MGDDAHQAAALLQFQQGTDGTVQGLRIQGTEPFVHQDGIQMQPAGVGFQHVGQAQGQGKRGKENLSAGQGGHCPGLAGEGIHDFQSQPLFFPGICDAVAAVQAVTALTDLAQPQVGSLEDIVQHCLEYKG